MDGMSVKQIKKKILETEKYFLPISEKRNTVAHNLIMKEISKLKAEHSIT
jgi:hypothetical protein